MKKNVLFLILTIVWLGLSGQVGPVFQYGHIKKEEIKKLFSEDTPKGLSYRTYLVQAINLGLNDTPGFKVTEADSIYIFDHLFLEEADFNGVVYQNSGYDSTQMRMISSNGNGWKGFVWVFRLGTFSLPLIKEDCGNILIAPIENIPLIDFSKQTTQSGDFIPEAQNQNQRTPFGGIRDINITININNQPPQLSPLPPTPPIIPAISDDVKTRTWMGRNWPWLVTAAVLTTTTCVVGNHNDWWRPRSFTTSGGYGIDPPLGDGKK